jgi:hypothetical protein
LVGVGDEQFSIAGEFPHQFGKMLLGFVQGDRVHKNRTSTVILPQNPGLATAETATELTPPIHIPAVAGMIAPDLQWKSMSAAGKKVPG